MDLPKQAHRGRSVSAILNNAIQFFQQNWKPLLKLFLIFCPVFMIPGIIFNYLHPIVATPHLKGFYYFEVNTLNRYFTEDTMIRSFLGDLSITAIGMTCLTYVKLFMQDGTVPSAQMILDKFKLSYISYYIAFVLASLVIKTGLLLLAVPGIYLMPIALLAITTMILENLSLQEATRRSFTLIKNYWGLTFGVVICAFLITSLAWIPSVLIFRKIDSTIHMPLVKTIVNIPFALLSGFLLMIPFIGIAFCYYALKEDQYSNQQLP